MTDKYYARQALWAGGRWTLVQRDAHGDRTLASGMSEKTARKAARLFNGEDKNDGMSGRIATTLDAMNADYSLPLT